MIRSALRLPDTVAAVDLGSNSFHMVVARISSGEIVVVDRLREMVRLAAGFGESRRLDRKSQRRALACLHRFGERVRHMPRGSVRAVGTNTLRSAHDASEFLAEAEDALGHPIDTVSGIEEARLIFMGVAHSLPDPGTRRLVVDIGGGSTELIVGEGHEPRVLESLYVGCVSLSERHFGGGTIKPGRWERAELEVRRELEAIQLRYRKRSWEKAVGASGTIRAIDRVTRAAGWSREGISAKALRRLRDAILAAGDVTRLDFQGLSEQRRPVFAGGVAVLCAVFEALGIEHMEYASGSLREGLLFDLVGRIRDADVRDATTAALADRYHIDRDQAQRVETTAVELHAQVAESWKLNDPEHQRHLRRAAQLHEIGLDIAHAHYHRHGEYVIANADLMGFTRDEQRLLATLVRAHRRKFPVSVIGAHPGRRRKAVERLAVLLRLAALLHRSRTPEPVPTPSVAAVKRSIRLEFPDRWLAAHPLTRTDLEQEAGYLDVAGYELEYA